MKNSIKVNSNWNLWDYLYYRTTIYYSKSEPKYGLEDHKRRGSYIVGLLISLNIESMVMLLFILFFQKTTFLIDYMGFVFVGLFLFIIFFSVYVYEKKRHNKIFSKYENEQIYQKISRGKILIIYIFFTFCLLFVSVYLGRLFWK